MKALSYAMKHLCPIKKHIKTHRINKKSMKSLYLEELETQQQPHSRVGSYWEGVEQVNAGK